MNNSLRSPCPDVDIVNRVVRIICFLLLTSITLISHAQTVGVVVSGLGGEEQYTQSFSATADAYVTALESLDSVPDTIMYLDESATRETIIDSIRQQALLLEQSSDGVFVLMLVGHGNASASTWRFNVSGPDLTTQDLVAALNEVSTSRQLIVLASSASGAALETLSQPGRVVVTATKSGGEVNAVRFPEYLAQAMTSTVADYDRNEILTIAEAYRFAESKTREYYEQQKLLASEHARLRGDQAADISVALLGSLEQAKDDPVVAALLSDRLILEKAFKQLKGRKDEMSTADFYAELETMLIEIATLQQSIDAATGWSETDADS